MFKITDNGIGLDDDNFDLFNTAFSRRKMAAGGKGLGRFTWLKAFEGAEIESVFRDTDEGLLSRSYIFSEHYNLDTPGLPKKIDTGSVGTTICSFKLKKAYQDKVPRSVEAIVQKLIEHFILVQPCCPAVTLIDEGQRHLINDIFDKDYKATASVYEFEIGEHIFKLHGFRLPTSRTTKHKLVYAADQRGVISDKLEDYVPNLSSRLEDENEKPFFYLAVVQSRYLSRHVNIGRTNFDFSVTDDADLEFDPDEKADLIPRSDIRNKALEFIERDLENIIETINTAKLESIRRYVHRKHRNTAYC